MQRFAQPNPALRISKHIFFQIRNMFQNRKKHTAEFSRKTDETSRFCKTYISTGNCRCKTENICRCSHIPRNHLSRRQRIILQIQSADIRRVFPMRNFLRHILNARCKLRKIPCKIIFVHLRQRRLCTHQIPHDFQNIIEGCDIQNLILCFVNKRKTLLGIGNRRKTTIRQIMQKRIQIQLCIRLFHDLFGEICIHRMILIISATFMENQPLDFPIKIKKFILAVTGKNMIHSIRNCITVSFQILQNRCQITCVFEVFVLCTALRSIFQQQFSSAAKQNFIFHHNASIVFKVLR